MKYPEIFGDTEVTILDYRQDDAGVLIETDHGTLLEKDNGELVLLFDSSLEKKEQKRKQMKELKDKMYDLIIGEHNDVITITPYRLYNLVCAFIDFKECTTVDELNSAVFGYGIELY